jgi:hypothetical protein
MTAMVHNEGLELFHGSRTRADLVSWGARLFHRCIELLSLDDLLGGSRTYNRRDAGVQFVPIKQIVASLDRQGDFTRSFLPRPGINADRWVRLYEALRGPQGFPEVELLRVGDHYAVVDGHHRISVAHAAGMQEIAAHVVEIVT